MTREDFEIMVLVTVTMEHNICRFNVALFLCFSPNLLYHDLRRLRHEV